MKKPSLFRKLKKSVVLPEKDLFYFTLQEACQSRDCPLCFHLDFREKKYIENIFYENVNDPTLRQQFRLSSGFCANHIRLILEIGDALGLAIIAADLAHHMIETEEIPSSRAHCFFCREYHTIEKLTVKAFANYLNDPEFRSSLSDSVGLCRRHHRLVWELIGQKDVRDFLRNLQIDCMRQRLNRLNEYIRKNDYQFQHEKITDQEKASIRIVWKLSRQ